jgi:L-fuconolactonase
MSTRREFLRTSACGAAAVALAGCANFNRAGSGAPGPIVDAHTHFYDPARPQGVPWPPKGDPVLYRTVLPEEFVRVAGPHGVTGTVVVEASPLVEDNDWVLELARTHPVIVGLVGNLLPGTSDFEGHVRRLARNRLFRGIRLRRDGGGEVTRGLTDPAFMRDLKLLADLDLALDVGIWSASLAEIARLAKELPSLRIVINHIAGAKVDGKAPPAEFMTGLSQAADRPRVFCKISGLAEHTGARGGTAPTDPAFYAPTIDAFWNTFGEDRLIYGSNWPVSNYAAPYDVVFNIVNSYFTARGAAARRKYFSLNASAAYKWVA